MCLSVFVCLRVSLSVRLATGCLPSFTLQEQLMTSIIPHFAYQEEEEKKEKAMQRKEKKQTEEGWEELKEEDEEDVGE